MSNVVLEPYWHMGRPGVPQWMISNVTPKATAELYAFLKEILKDFLYNEEFISLRQTYFLAHAFTDQGSNSLNAEEI
jgi:hypothetical protein